MAAAYKEFGGASEGSRTDAMFLRTGDTGSEVKDLQVLLRRAGYALVIDGDFGPATKRAVMAFQRDFGLGVDGVVGPQTWSALQSLGGVG